MSIKFSNINYYLDFKCKYDNICDFVILFKKSLILKLLLLEYAHVCHPS